MSYLCPGHIQSNLLRHLKGGQKAMKLIMNAMASPTEVGADRIVRLAVSSEFQGVTGTYMNEDKIKTPHPESQIAEKRQQVAKITKNALSQWM